MKTATLPAVAGGSPVRQTWLPYSRQALEEDDLKAVLAVLKSDWLTTGPAVQAFETAVAERVRARHAVAFSSGTAALQGAVFAAGLQAGDEAVVTPLTFCATANVLLHQGATPVFADVSPDTLTLDPAPAEAAVTPRTKAIVPVDYAGHPADLDALMALAQRRGLVVIEDACHALGAEDRGRRVGAVSHMTAFSFHAIKHVTTGEGGMVTTDSEAFARRLRMFRNHGIDGDARAAHADGAWQYEMVALGSNCRLTDIGCALGLSQLPRLDANLSRRRAIAARYTEAFQDLPGVAPPAVRPGANPVWHLYPVRVDAARRNDILRALRAENIGASVHYIPVHLHPYYRGRFGYRGGECPVAEGAAERLISLPIFHGMSDQDVDDVIEAAGKVVQHYAGES